MNYINLKKYGLNERFEQEAMLYEGLFLARVIEQHRDLYKVVSEQGELFASVSGKMLYSVKYSTEFPAVGDWVMIDRMNEIDGKAVIHNLLNRKSLFERKSSGTSGVAQIVASNIDIVFICMSLNADFNLRRLERYLAIAWDSMATPVIVLTKADICEDLPQKLSEIQTVCMGTDVVVCSSVEENGYQSVMSYISNAKTIAFIGSSGVGKSTLINRLMGKDVLLTNEIRQDDKGRHTTTYRQLLLLPNGGIVIDTPGMRELHLETGNLSKTFEDIESLSQLCKYKDCTHTSEPGCAIQARIEDGELSAERFSNYKKLQREIGYEGLNSRQLEQEKINRMFGSKGQMKQVKKFSKNKKI